ncbi:MAG TPA: Spy/CpxP family protein refolding chaperone [Nevskia sp.]|nr:Spy/CpxP family protein refolding chaperone [Nevskia sp.]
MQRFVLQSPHPAARALAAAALIAGIGAMIPARAQAPEIRVIVAAASPAPTPAAAEQASAAESTAGADRRVEARIKDLHARLAITTPQEDSWAKVAKVMRDNAATMVTLTQARAGKANVMTAVDDLKSYAEIAQAHADGIEKFAPVFGALYDSMSDQQKKNADAIFRARSYKATKHTAAKAG